MQHELLSSEIDRLRTRATLLADASSDPEQSLATARAAIADLQASVEELVVTEEELHRQRSELLRTNAVLEAERERHVQLFERAPVALLITDREGVIEAANLAAADLLGFASGGLCGKPISLLVARDDRRSWHALTERIFADGALPGRQSIVLRLADCELRVLVDGVLQPATLVSAARFAFVLEDMSLCDRVAQLEGDEQRKDEFIAMVSHELRNPLAPIRAAVDMWRHHGGELTDLQRDWMVEVVSRQAEHLAYLVDDLLDISRIVHGKIRIERTNLDLRTIVEDAVTVVRARASHHDVELELPELRLPVQGDPIRLRQIFVNLLDNALKFTPKGGAITIACDVIDGQVRTRVRDNGIGMDPAQLREVFGLFAQDHRTLHEAGGGLGLGLALVRHLAELHGGTAVARSEGIGCGSELEIRLPYDPRRPTGETVTSGSVSALAPLRLLVVDDNVDAAEMLGLLLEADGHTVTLAFTGEEAVAAFVRVQPDAVLLDLGLPDIDGIEVGRRLKTVAPELPLLAISGWSDPALRPKVRDAGFVAHLLKPLELRALQKLLDKVTRREP